MSASDRQRRALVCVTGCIAAYKACEIVRLLQKQDIDVTVCMSEHATRFVGPTTFRALTHHKVAVCLFDDPEDPIHHISLAQWADIVIVAPATANIIAKMTHGIADDLMSTTLLATRAPILVAPAMNAGMWEAAATQENIDTLARRGVHIVQPDSGYLACGEIASGRLPEPADIVDRALAVLGSGGPLQGERVLITAGGTHEPIDPVRFIGNRSSGKMGVALAYAAQALGAQVTLVLGPHSVRVPASITCITAETASQMLDAARAAFDECSIAVCAAAVADYTPCSPADHKLKKDVERLDRIELEETTDILADLSSRKGDRTVIGFAAETSDVVLYATRKLATKGCDAIVANDVSRDDSGFGADTDQAWWIDATGAQELPCMDKSDLARVIFERALALRPEG
ncbi:bifunctional phosphopantothenoylcysteine decarboxylase/phosphopantothenate--cysteine ligase CoaBC [Collinsella tanakaei]|uniref:bifunctional phosphopantothenoylcysteine decarboxylase/phosphopantothenate--cysteine ligase CoaBC n=1 Tax=Collinsella tanakaei TaxID=626935 RepID=UPI001F33E218|nr:bifunctional phosphopantothenoylcysteine decarboxylase/phosphopantothenate--cysteine ligase CoaBC [Collinsella tanakaei]MCF2620847.1 bifunctional phosphopantothenoylcysteine decarboxylase/phosphopantothenate--cysteine ligase CoaBC [Collinsella tanakaei]